MSAPEIPEEQADTGKKKRRPSRNLPIAVAVGAGLGAMVLVSLYTVKEVFLGVVVVFLGVAVWEFIRAFATRGIRIPWVPVMAGVPTMLLLAYIWGTTALVASFGLTVLAVLLWRLALGMVVISAFVWAVSKGFYIF